MQHIALVSATRRLLRVSTSPAPTSGPPTPGHSINEPKSALISRMRHIRPSTEFRRTWQYNNLGYIVASTLPEHIYGIPFETFVKERIFDPLGMTETSYSPARVNRSDAFVRRGMDFLACLQDLEGKALSSGCLGESVNIGPTPTGGMHAGPGGVVSSAKDMVCVYCLSESSSYQLTPPSEPFFAFNNASS